MLRGRVYIDKVRQKNRLFQTEGHSFLDKMTEGHIALMTYY